MRKVCVRWLLVLAGLALFAGCTSGREIGPEGMRHTGTRLTDPWPMTHDRWERAAYIRNLPP